MEAYNRVVTSFGTPFPLYPFQQRAVNELSGLQNCALYFDQGTGKTDTSIHMALDRFLRGEADHCVVLMPPILIDGWMKSIGRYKGVTVQAYRGTPRERRDIKLGSTAFTLMSYNIFRQETDEIQAQLRHKRVMVIADEATALKNIQSQTHRKFEFFSKGCHRILLTGTPLSNPNDGYAYIKIVAPGVYRNHRQFERVHVKERDFMYGHVTEWKNLDLLAENMKVNAHRVLRFDVIHELPSVSYVPIPYKLDPSHYRLYKKLAEEQLLVLADGGKIDATQSTRLYNALQQIIVNYGYFASDPSKRSAAFDVVDETIEGLGDRKLIVSANYRMSNESLFEHLKIYNPRVIYGGNTSKQNSQAVEDFKSDPSVRILVMQPTSGGYGIDGLQTVCNDVLFIESPIVPRDFHQLVARVHRNGQQEPVNIRIAYAIDTIQVLLHERLLGKDELINTLVRGPEDLRRALYGNT